MSDSRRKRVLAIEDNAGDRFLLREALSALEDRIELEIAPDGESALRSLREGEKPDLLLLDVNLPRKGGLEVLGEIVGDSRFRDVPALVLSTSVSPWEVEKARSLGVLGYVTKGFDIEDFFQRLRRALGEWLAEGHCPSLA
jgi:CheY-like chemotaxis protein